MAVNLSVAILVVGGGAALVWTGLANPSDGLMGELGRVLRGEPTETASKGGLGMIGRQASEATQASLGSGGGAVGGAVVAPGQTGGRTGVLSVAEAQLGKPYVWGGKGPANFDCSGLVQYVYQHGAGMSVPAPAASQALRGVAVSEAEAQPGDLVCYGHPAWHIGIYLGNKRLLHAANPSKGVCTESVTWNGDRYYRSLLGKTVSA
jgi:cell wall-associated NlpC family hydrolase